MNKTFALTAVIFTLFAAPVFADKNEAIQNYYQNKKVEALAENYRSARQARLQEERETELFELQKKALLAQNQGPVDSELNAMQKIVDDGRDREAAKKQDQVAE